MPIFPPSQSDDIFDVSQQLFGKNPQPADGFQAARLPSQTGLGTRTGRLPTFRSAVSNRQMIHFLVPEGPIVQMYVNPQRIVYDYSKNIDPQRTKGGWSIQYWGENLTTLNIDGTTGTSGIEGINVLHDIYRHEQLAFDPYALFLAQKQYNETFTGDIFGLGSALSEAASFGDAASTFLDALTGASQQSNPQAATQAPTLASLAFQVEMYWSGEVYRGFFTGFTVTESVDNLGMFNYNIKFTVTQKRGFRTNFLAWHRSPVNGPSNSNPLYGTPYSYGQLVEGNISPPKRLPQPDVISEVESLGEYFTSLFG